MFNDVPIERFSFNFSVEGDDIVQNQSMDESDDQSTNQSTDQSMNQSYIPGKEHFIRECSLAQPNNLQSVNHLLNQSINQSNQSLSQSSDQAIDQSLNLTINDGVCQLSSDTVTFCGDVTFLRPSINHRPGQLSDVLADSDVTKHVYEGGMKLWECAIDLVQFMHDQSISRFTNQSIKPTIELNYSSVLDLGCGHGFTGLYPLIYLSQNLSTNQSINQSSDPSTNQSIHVTFQDLNPEVLIESTMNHALVNIAARYHQSIDQSIQTINQQCRFISGDWCSPSLISLLNTSPTNQSKYSLILTSDTLYEPSMLDPLLSLIENCLSINGVALIAAKRYYFGIGGGTVALISRVNTLNKMEAKVERVIEDGKSNIREIVSLRWKQ